VLDDVSFDVKKRRGFFSSSVHPASGKSILIKHLIGLLSPDGGEIWLDVRRISRYGETQMDGVRKMCAMCVPTLDALDSMTCAKTSRSLCESTKA